MWAYLAGLAEVVLAVLLELADVKSVSVSSARHDAVVVAGAGLPLGVPLQAVGIGAGSAGG